MNDTIKEAKDMLLRNAHRNAQNPESSSGKLLLGHIIDELKGLERPFGELQENEQNRTIKRLNAHIHEFIHKMTKEVFDTGSFICALGEIKGVSVKNKATANIELLIGANELGKFCARFSSYDCLVTLLDLESQKAGMSSIVGEPDQQHLPLNECPECATTHDGLSCPECGLSMVGTQEPRYEPPEEWFANEEEEESAETPEEMSEEPPATKKANQKRKRNRKKAKK